MSNNEKQEKYDRKLSTQSGGVEFNRNADLINETLADVIESGGEPSCESFLIDGVCPKSRYLSTECPFNIIVKGYKECTIKKEP